MIPCIISTRVLIILGGHYHFSKITDASCMMICIVDCIIVLLLSIIIHRLHDCPADQKVFKKVFFIMNYWTVNIKYSNCKNGRNIPLFLVMALLFVICCIVKVRHTKHLRIQWIPRQTSRLFPRQRFQTSSFAVYAEICSQTPS